MATVETRQDVHIDLHYLTRIEGHGHLRIDTRRGDIERCELNVVEAPRFLEAMLVGRPHAQAPHLASRICGICSVSHTTASVRAVEKALGIEVSPQTEDLRKLAFYGEILDSHILHAYLLVAPDFFGQPSAIALAGEQPEVVTRALRMKRLAGDLCAVLAGRHTHPISIAVGGFRHLPTTATVAGLLDRLVEARADVAATLDLFRDLSFPPLNRETEVLALRRDDEYAFIDGDIACSDGGRWPVDRYAGVVEEHVVSHSTAKHSRHARNPYMVGALARFKINHDRLHPKAKGAAAALGLTPEASNPYLITAAQIVELVHCLEEAITLCQRLVDRGLRRESLVMPSHRSGEGVGVVEAPRGMLVHHYQIENAIVGRANCIIPTNQNLANLEADMRQLVPQILPLGTDEVTRRLEMLVRAYDPCISCATHVLDIDYA
ncbi:MAG TPA: Ni/Fe hydrogenase subunit alpha [Anaerolineales bacterium]|nr:Ni/Fe hydrogenase subunit alpha [Anaerolineales bacterium]